MPPNSVLIQIPSTSTVLLCIISSKTLGFQEQVPSLRSDDRDESTGYLSRTNLTQPSRTSNNQSSRNVAQADGNHSSQDCRGHSALVLISAQVTHWGASSVRREIQPGRRAHPQLGTLSAAYASINLGGVLPFDFHYQMCLRVLNSTATCLHPTWVRLLERQNGQSELSIGSAGLASLAQFAARGSIKARGSILHGSLGCICIVAIGTYRSTCGKSNPPCALQSIHASGMDLQSPLPVRGECH